MANNRNISYLCTSQAIQSKMKYSEFHRKITKNDWVFSHASGSHYFYKKEIKDKEGKIIEVICSPPVPYHGAKEMPEPLRRAIARDMNLR